VIALRIVGFALFVVGGVFASYNLGLNDGCKEARAEQAQLRAKIELILEAYKRVDGKIVDIYSPKPPPKECGKFVGWSGATKSIPEFEGGSLCVVSPDRRKEFGMGGE
jgi:hypothetical protein